MIQYEIISYYRFLSGEKILSHFCFMKATLRVDLDTSIHLLAFVLI